MKDIGLTKAELTFLSSVFQRYPEVGKVLVFGSRAKGNYKKNSDVDLAVTGIQNNLELEAMAMELEELPLPYKFDVTSLSDIKNQALIDHIYRVGVSIYP